MTVTEVRAGNTMQPASQNLPEAQQKFLDECGEEYMGSGKKSWIFVRNNYTDADQQLLRDLEKTVMVFGREKGAQGTPHLQGFVTFSKPYRFGGLKKVLDGWHIQPAISAEKAFNYCLKEMDYEIDDRRRQGHRSELDGPTEAIRNGKRMREVAMTWPEVYVKHHRGFKALQSEICGNREWYCDCWIFFGPAGTCKTAYAKAFFENDYYLLSHKKWWQRYEGQRKVIVNEFSEDWWDIDTFCNVVDRGAYDCERKGDSFPLQADHIIITTNEDPRKWYENNNSRWKFERRVKMVNFWPRKKMLEEFKTLHSWWKFK